jgi:hypothetical protein
MSGGGAAALRTLAVLLAATGVGLSSATAFERPGSLVERANVVVRGCSILGGGCSLARLGDVNADGLADVAVAHNAGALLLFGARSDIFVEAARPGQKGLDIRLGPVGRYSGRGVAAAGDVNGDGLADALVADVVSWPQAGGTVFVVYGAREAGAVDVSAPAFRGFRVDGAPGTLAGVALAGGGDVNGDGLSDIAIAAPPRDLPARAATYVLFGSRAAGPVLLPSLEGRGFSIDSGAPAGAAAVAVAGDMTGDGLAEVLVATARGTVVVLGRRETGPVNADALGGNGFLIAGASWPRAAGDVNGDGLADAIVSSGPTAYVVYGGPEEDVDVTHLGARGIRISGRTLLRADGAGDVNRDGFADIVLTSQGSVSVVFGGRGSEPIDLDTLGDRGRTWPWPIRFVSPAKGVGDVNGDGRADLGIAQPASSSEHEAYIVFTGVARLLLRAGPITVRPLRPMAGRTFTASFAVRRSGTATPITFGRTTCDALTSTEPVTLVGRRLSKGRATCTWRVARAAAGMVVHGSVTFEAGRSAVERRFRVRVAAAIR